MQGMFVKPADVECQVLFLMGLGLIVLHQDVTAGDINIVSKLNGDTLWVECTNPRIPLGYRHDDIAGHQVVLIKENGGELVRCGRYPDSLSRLENKVRVLLSSTGDAFVDVQERAFLDFTESRISFPTLSTKDQTDRMASKVLFI